MGFVPHNCWVSRFSLRWRALDGHCRSLDKKGRSKDRTREKRVKIL